MEGCQTCAGGGLIRVREGADACPCVKRRICRAVVNRLLEIMEQQGGKASVRLDCSSGGTKVKHFSYGRPLEEFAADAFLIARRKLNPAEYNCFRWAMILGADWKVMAKRLHLDRGNYYHLYYKTEVKLGEAWATTMPYSVFPINEYFGNRKGDAEAAPTGN